MMNNKRGAALIISFILVVFLAGMAGYLFSNSIYEREVTRIFEAQTKALWAAEAGVAWAVAYLPNATAVNSASDTWDNENNKLTYNTTLPTLVGNYTNRWTFNSTGKYVIRPISTRPEEKRERCIKVVVAQPSQGYLGVAIESTGTITIGGSVEINPPGSEKSNSALTFEGVFGMTKLQLKALADHVYTDPSTNQQPVNGITWVDLTGTNKYQISSTWSGSGMLIVNGNGTDIALDISGSWQFSGVIWVIGKLSVSGNPTLTGVVFAESGAEVNKLVGNATLNFSAGDRDSAFGLITAKGSALPVSWEEI